MGVPTPKRLRKRNDFQTVRSLGQRVFCKSFVCQYYRFPQEQSVARRRLGVIASRRVGNAVKRNRGKRIIRELFRIHESRLPQNCDVVIILRSCYSLYSFADMESHYLKACAAISKNGRFDT